MSLTCRTSKMLLAQVSLHFFACRDISIEAGSPSTFQIYDVRKFFWAQRYLSDLPVSCVITWKSKAELPLGLEQTGRYAASCSATNVCRVLPAASRAARVSEVDLNVGLGKTDLLGDHGRALSLKFQGVPR
jgi:hypothetical protein